MSREEGRDIQTSDWLQFVLDFIYLYFIIITITIFNWTTMMSSNKAGENTGEQQKAFCVLWDGCGGVFVVRADRAALNNL